MSLSANTLLAIFLLAAPQAFLAAQSMDESPAAVTVAAVPQPALPEAPLPRLASIEPGDPLPAPYSSSASDVVQEPAPTELTHHDPKEIEREKLTAGCADGTLRGKQCKVHWLPILWQSFEFLTAQHSGNILLDSETRQDLTYLPYWSTYAYDVEHYRWYQWSDDTTFVVHDIGHPMMGGITSSIFEQNDPKGRGLKFENNGNYWRSRLKAMAWSALYSAQWKVGPVSEAAIGDSGRNTYFVPSLGRTTNETGFQDFVITPVYGMGWNVGEDAIDRYIMPHVFNHVHKKIYKAALFWMTPCKSAANLLRYKAPYYRDQPYPAAEASGRTP